MLSLSTQLASRTQIQALPETKKAAATDAAAVASTDEAKPAVSVTISGAAMKAAAAEKTSNSDIDDSGLADNVKNLLKMIREIKKQIAEKQAEMAAVMADKTLSPEQARARLSGLQSALSGLQASLNSAQASLAKAMKDMSAGDAVKAASLAMK
ncbi:MULTISPECIES: VCBS domain-containing protein [Pseudomonas]|uniref:VCBS domain-containing protein n=1 Tax=Pseudomonas TaxID=286 RepID=UPI001C2F97BB|nr:MULTISPECIES: VCBS domain-containing protein [Pseudomonas]MBV2082323.1 VCBS domain-containing protein [Pseudomonas carnis]MBV2086233.1 VCBS domain-containing protein [Pseudomonas carnis]MDO3689814.1 VCBS domain-containing protein [Pseudomonas sp. DKN 2791]MDO7033786.1 VCBS domain-containing protein [Pseudomonas sp. DKN 2792]